MRIALQMQFYEAAAQVIPVLLLVMAVGESSLRPRRTEPRWASYLALAMVFFIVIGEIVALGVLASGEEGRLSRSLTAQSIGMGLSFIVFRFALSLWEDSKKADAGNQSWATVLMLPVGLVAGIAVLLASSLYLASR